MIQHHKWSLTELDNMLPYERQIYVTLLQQWIKEENDRVKEQQRQNKCEGIKWPQPKVKQIYQP